MRPFRLALGLTAAFLLAPPAVDETHAQQAAVYASLSVPPYSNLCNADVAANQLVTVTVSVSTPFNFQSVRFSIPNPPGVALFGPTAVGGGSVTGDFATGVEVTFPSCRSQGNVLQFSMLTLGGFSDYTWIMGPPAGATSIELEDCNGFPMRGTGEWSIYCDQQSWFGPYRPDPPNGATDVPPDQLLSFVGGANQLLLGTDPDLGEADFVCGLWLDPNDPCAFPFDPELLPNTTYYWQAFYSCGGGCNNDQHGRSDVWSFTTGDATLATEKTTWGRVKALYRD